MRKKRKKVSLLFTVYKQHIFLEVNSTQQLFGHLEIISDNKWSFEVDKYVCRTNHSVRHILKIYLWSGGRSDVMATSNFCSSGAFFTVSTRVRQIYSNIFGYFEVLLGTVRYFWVPWVLWGTFRYWGWRSMLTSEIYHLNHNWAKLLLVMDTFATCFVIFRLNPERYKYKLFMPDRVYT